MRQMHARLNTVFIFTLFIICIIIWIFCRYFLYRLAFMVKLTVMIHIYKYRELHTYTNASKHDVCTWLRGT